MTAAGAADALLENDPEFLKAMVIKSEALYNMCHFEHALVLFHRGQVMGPRPASNKLFHDLKFTI